MYSFRNLTSGLLVAGALVSAAPGVAQLCAIPGRDGSGSITGTVNTYYPGTGTPAAGATSVTVGTRAGSATNVAVGDLVMIIQMQDAQIDSSDTDQYGDGVLTSNPLDPGRGSTAVNNSGANEFVVATSALTNAGGTLNFVGGGTGGGLVNAYATAAATGTRGQRTYQVIRVPQYVTATLTSGLTALAWNGSVGGVLAIDVSGTVDWNGATVDLSGLGFRAGAGVLKTGGGADADTAYRSLSTSAFNGAKAEGIAGTPIDMWSGTALVHGPAEGYPNGSYARGGPGNAGGGGTDGNQPANDENSGGGGGGNGGIGGQGGNSWSSNLATRGGFGGAAFTNSATALVLGGGGGAGSMNNGDDHFGNTNLRGNGGRGGALIHMRFNNTTGTGTLRSDGAAGAQVGRDGAGGGGAGGTIFAVGCTGLSGLTAQARGGAGGNTRWANPPQRDDHGPGGGGAGGAILTSAAATTDVTAGAHGGAGEPTNGVAFVAYGSTDGGAGTTSAAVTALSPRGAFAGCTCINGLGTIGDRIWIDTDRDGVQDIGEPGISGVTVQLSYAGPDGVFGTGDDVASYATTVTGDDGLYAFPGLPPGVYRVSTTAGIPAGFTVATGSSSPSATRTITGNEVFNDLDIGYWGTSAATGIIGNEVWNDTDGDGIRDNGEPGIGGVTVTLRGAGADGVFGTGDDTTATTTTNAAGYYYFTGLANGDYQVQPTTASGPLVGATLTVGPQSNTNPTSPVTVTPGLDYTQADFGFQRTGTHSITDRFFRDVNLNAAYDAGTDTFVSGITVNLFDSGGNLVATTITDANGQVVFTGLPNGTYSIRPADNQAALAGLFGTTVDAIDKSHAVTLAGADVSADSFGYGRPGSISGTVFSDANGNQVRDAGESALAGVTVDLYLDRNNSGTLTNTDAPVLLTTTTDAQGNYSFDGLAPGRYWTSVGDTIVVGGQTLTHTTTDQDGSTPGGTQRSPVVITGSESFAGQDFGYRLTTLADVNGTVFNDFNRDGLKNGVETGFTAVTVAFLDSTGKVVATTTTSGTGAYSFPDVPPGSYRVAVTDQAGVLVGYTLTSDLDTVPITVGTSGTTTVDFGYARDPGVGCAAAAGACTNFGTGAIGDSVWLDGDRNGFQNPGEPGISGVTVRLFDAGPDRVVGTGDDVLAGTTVTDANGQYIFRNLAPDYYYVDYVGGAGTPLVNLVVSGGSDPSALINLSQGEYFDGADVGYRPTSATNVAIGDTVFFDANLDGIQQPGEVGIAGVTVTVTGPAAFSQVVTTGADGRWLVQNLVPGSTYTVTVTAPAGYNATPTNGPLVRTFAVPATPVQDVLYADYGFRDDATPSVATISGNVCLDANFSNTCTGAPTDPALPNVTVNLVGPGADGIIGNADDVIAATTTTDSSGAYSFSGVPANGVLDYQVRVTDVHNVLQGLNLATGNTNPISVNNPAAGSTTSGLNFPYQASNTTLGTIGNLVFRDKNNDGIHQAAEAGIQGVTVQLWLDNNNNGVIDVGVDNLIRTTTTDQNGNYEFDAVPAGNYVTHISDVFGVLTGFSSSGAAGNAGIDDRAQVDPYARALAANASDLTADFGYRATTPRTITGTTFQDVNGNAVLNAGVDVGVGGVKLYLYRDLDGDGVLDPGEPLIDSTVSLSTGVPATQGTYTFSDVPDVGRYIVVSDPIGTSLAGKRQTTQTATRGVQPVFVNGANVSSVDFGYNSITTAALVVKFTATRRNGQVELEWTTASEAGTVGFEVYRLNPRTGRYRRIHDGVLASLQGAPQGGFYSLIDTGAGSAATQVYRLVEIESAGGTRSFGPWRVSVREGARGERMVDAPSGFESRARPVQQAFRERVAAAAAERATFVATMDGRGPRPGRDLSARFDITVRDEGWYYVSSARMAAASGVAQSTIDALLAASNVRLSNRGNDIAVVPAKQGFFFYGTPIYSIYTADNVYVAELSRQGTAALVVGGSGPAALATPPALPAVQHVEKQSFAATSVSTDPTRDYWFWDFVSAGDPTYGTRSFSFDLPGAIGASGGSLRIGVFGATDTSAPTDHHLSVSLNGVSLGEFTFDGVVAASRTFAVPPGTFLPSGNQVAVTSLLDTGAPYSFVYIDNFDVLYQREARAVDNRLSISGGPTPVITVAGFDSPSILALDVTNPVQPVVLPVTVDSTDSFRASFASRTGARYYVASPSTAVEPPLSFHGPSQLRSTTGADYVVVAPDFLLPAAQDLASYRTHGGMRTLVVGLSEIYDEFNDGIASPEAIRTFVDYAAKYWAFPPRYLVLAGKGSFDYKGYLAIGGNLMPPLMKSTPYGLFASDALFVQDVTGVSVGRLPVLSGGELEAYLAKLQAYESAPADAWQRHAVFTADNPDEAGNFPTDSDNLSGLLPGSFAVDKVYLSGDSGQAAAAHAALLADLAPGALLWNYIGHGAMDRLAAEPLFSSSDVASLSVGSGNPAFVSMTCAAGRFEVPGFTSLAETLVLAPNGAIVALSPSGLSLNDEAVKLNRGLMGLLFTHSVGRPGFGDATRSALTQYAKRTDAVPFMIWIYNVLGDPAVSVH